jgi:predicted dehydrogenase
MSRDRLGVGFVGAGFNAQFHIRSWVGVRGADVLGIVSRDRAEDAAALARSLGVGEAQAYATITDMVADPAIDAIWICAGGDRRGHRIG